LAERISAASLKPLLTDGAEIAFLDIREHGQYGEGHPFFSIPIPYSRLESLAARLLPCKSVRMVLMDDGDGVSERAAQRLQYIGYRNVAILDGGVAAWAAAGYNLFKGVNVPSKTFGEMLEHQEDTPRLTATELHSLMARDETVVVLDGRSPAEFEKMSLPGAGCCPNAELGYRLRTLVPDESTTVVINCAGRTRSILGAEGLRLLNVRNPVYALENGTQGWRLAGFQLEHGALPKQLPAPGPAMLEGLADLATTIIDSRGLKLLSPETVAGWLEEPGRTTYLLDVRTEQEFASSHWPGARHAPGGQLVQATDQYVAVRNARIVLSDDIRLRAATTAVWLKEMGHDVYLLDTDARIGGVHDGIADENGKQPSANAQEFKECAAGVAMILDASRGMEFRTAHVEGACWVTRARVDKLDIEPDEAVLVTGRDKTLIDGVRVDLEAMGFEQVRSCAGSPEIWADAGFKLVSTEEVPAEPDCIDYLFFVHDRHDGNMDAARRYLEWETGLLDQLDAQEKSVLNPGATSKSRVNEANA